MLLIKDRIESLVNLGTWLKTALIDIGEGKNNKLSLAITKAGNENGWFTKEAVIQSLEAINGWLNEKVLADWSNRYFLSEPAQPKIIAVIMAGNIPMVNFHDFLAVLITGHKFLGKSSSQDKVLLPFIADQLIAINPDWKDRIEFTDGRLTQFDAVIATGSTNTSRYFEYYFGKYPNIIRKNRHSIAILTGTETAEDLMGLYQDIFNYYGLGCRNVSMLMVPKDYDLPQLLRLWEGQAVPTEHHKYNNNYDYYRSLFLINSTSFFDSGYASFLQSDQLTSPISVIHYYHYTDIHYVEDYLKAHADQIQCVVSNLPITQSQVVSFGRTQCPAINDYPDQVDIIQFLLAL